MRGIRLALLLVTLGLGLPVAGLVWRALDGIALERAVAHQAVADRSFDEMEAELSKLLIREEARPFEHYRFYLNEGERSPLATPGPEPFVVGSFQVDPDGSVHSPLRPRDVEAAKRRGDWPVSADIEQAIANVTSHAAELWRSPKAFGESPSVSDDARVGSKEQVLPQDPGTTRALGGPLAKRSALKAKKDGDAALSNDESSAYEVLQRLNRAAGSRSDRKVQVAKARPQRKPAPQASAPSVLGSAISGGAAVAEAEESIEIADIAMGEAKAERATAQRREAPGRSRSLPEPIFEQRTESLSGLGDIITTDSLEKSTEDGISVVALESDSESDSETDLKEDSGLRVALEPMVGRVVDDTSLLLYRTVLVGHQGYRQGLLLDRELLGAWLSERALGSTGLSEIATLDFESTGSRNVDGVSFQHRFAEPFDALSAQLHLRPLPGTTSASTIYALVALLAIVGMAGLFAIHHMASVVVNFAERRSNFVAAVTHELKTPLTAIRMYAEMLRDGLVPSDAKRSEYYETITSESERLSRLIDNVLEFSRLDRGTREMSLHVGSIGPVLEEAAEKLRTHAASEGFMLELEVGSELPPIRYDRDALFQVIYNLVDNAMKYAASAEPRRIRLEATQRDAGVELSVRDYGPGVEGQHLAHVFEPFYRGEDELTRQTKGTGIGLALVKELGERMGARVAGSNVEGGGFRVGLWFEAVERA